MDNLNDILQRLHGKNAEFVLVGGLAAVVHGVTLVTRDVDICCRFNEENLMRIQEAVCDLHPVHRSRPDVPLSLTPDQCASLKNLYLKTDLGVLDCLGEVLGIGTYDEVLKNSVVAELPFGEIRVLAVSALIKAKEAMHRDHDLITVKHLKAIIDHQRQKKS
jgi:hypothetical protein